MRGAVKDPRTDSVRADVAARYNIRRVSAHVPSATPSPIIQVPIIQVPIIQVPVAQ